MFHNPLKMWWQEWTEFYDQVCSHVFRVFAKLHKTFPELLVGIFWNISITSIPFSFKKSKVSYILLSIHFAVYIVFVFAVFTWTQSPIDVLKNILFDLIFSTFWRLPFYFYFLFFFNTDIHGFCPLSFFNVEF